MAPKRPIVPLGVSVTGAAELLGVSRSTIYRLLRAGELTASRIGTKPIVHTSSIDGYLARTRIPSVDELD